MESAVATELPVTQQRDAIAYPQGLPLTPQWSGEDAEGGDGVSVSSLLHSLRRQWLPALGVGMLMATLFSALLWLLIPVEFQAVALLRVNRDESFKKGGGTIGDYMTYKETQASLFRSSFVLSRALADNDISQLPMVKFDGFGRRRLRPVAWLADEIKVDSQGESELIQVRMSGKDKEDTEKILDRVVEAYDAEIVNKERLEKVEMLQKLRKRYRVTDEDVKQRVEDVARLSKQVGNIGDKSIQTLQNILVGELSSARRQHELLSQEYAAAIDGLRLLVLGAQLTTGGPSEHAIEDELESDKEYYGLRVRIRELKDEVKRLSAVLRPDAPQLAQYQQEIGLLERNQAALRKELTPRVVARIKSREGQSDGDRRMEILLKKQNIQNLAEAVKRADEAYKEKFAELNEYGGTSSELESRQDELFALRKELATMHSEIAGLEIELDGPPRIRVMQSATVLKDSSWMSKIGQIAGAWVITVLGVMAAIAYWDFLGKKVNTSEDLTRSIRVIGTLPAIQQSGSPFSRFRRELLEDAMKVSVDGVRTALLYNRERKSQVVLVTSATGQEGRSTVASQLAVSFGRSGKRTLLIDGDVLSPQQHLIFSVQMRGGFSEMLRGELTADDAVVATSMENVWLLCAGRCDQMTLQALSGAGAEVLFQELRERFDVVVVDSSPVLTSADALLLGQHVDTAIISARRDVSQLPKVSAAADRLISVGVHVLGAVVNGTDVELRSQAVTVADDADEPQPALTEASS